MTAMRQLTLDECLELLAEAEAGFRFYHCTPDRSDYLLEVPHRLNILVSTKRVNDRPMGITRHLPLAKSVFLDSGLITWLKLVESGKATLADVTNWMRQQDKVREWAHKLHALGVKSGVAAMMDHPCEPWLLEKAGTTVEAAVKATIENAAHWRTADLPPGWKRVYVAQGWTLKDYGGCMDAFEELGILDEIRRDEAWLAAGTTCMRKPPELYGVYDFLRKRLGTGHLHALGIARPEWVAHMVHRGWIQTADSATASIAVAFNRGKAQWHGKGRPNYLVRAMYAAEMETLEAEIHELIDAPPDAIRPLPNPGEQMEFTWEEHA